MPRKRGNVIVKKKMYALLSIVSFTLFACSANENAGELYKSESPLLIEITTPNTRDHDNTGKIETVLTQDGKPVDAADFVHFEIWKQDGTLSYGMENAIYEGNGKYSITKSFPKNGLYLVKVHARSKGSLIMPKKQFIIGELTAADREFLKNSGSATEEPLPDGHH